MISGSITRAEILQHCRSISDLIDSSERRELDGHLLLAGLDELNPEDETEQASQWDERRAEVLQDREDSRNELWTLLANLAELVDELEAPS